MTNMSKADQTKKYFKELGKFETRFVELDPESIAAKKLGFQNIDEYVYHIFDYPRAWRVGEVNEKNLQAFEKDVDASYKKRPEEVDSNQEGPAIKDGIKP